MRNIVIDGSKVTNIGGVEYYYGEVTLDKGSYIVVPDINNYIVTYDSVYNPEEFDENINYDGFALSHGQIESPVWKSAITDSENKVLYGFKQDSSIYKPDLSGYTMNDGHGHNVPVPEIIDYFRWVLYGGRTYRASYDRQVFRLAVSKDYANPQGVTPFTYTIYYDITPLRVVQLEDRDNLPVTPYTSAKGVVLESGNDIETQIKYMNKDVISEEESEVHYILSGSTDDAVNDVREEGAEYREDINELAAHVEEIDAKVFPLDINAVITTDFSSLPWQNTISVAIKEYDTGEPDLNNVYAEKWVNNSYVGKVYEPSEYQSVFSFNGQIDGMKEKYQIVASTTNGKSDTEVLERYLCFYGANEASDMTSDIVITLDKRLTTGVSFNPTITTEKGQYIWLIVPNYLSITNVKSYGFSVTLNEPTSVSVENFGTYKCYRTLNALDNATWKLVIS